MKRHSLLFKTVAVVLIHTFLYQQILLASDFPYGLPAQNDSNRSGFMTADRLEESQARQEELISRLQENLAWRIQNGYATEEDIELQKKISSNQTASSSLSPQNNTLPEGEDILSLTTQAGDLLNYRGQTLERIVQKDGTILEEITFSESGDISSAIIRFTDGGVATVEEGRIKSYAAPDGRTTHYGANGLVEYEVAPDGVVAYYAYEFDTNGDILKVTVTTYDAISEYDKDLRLIKVTKSDGTIIEYQSGVISKITYPDGTSLELAISTNADGGMTSKPSRYITAAGAIYRYIEDAAGALAYVEIEVNGAVATYNKEGTLLKIVKDTQEITDQTLIDAQAEYDRALAVYQDRVRDREAAQLLLDQANQELEDAIAISDAKKALLDDKIVSRQQIESDINDLKAQIQSTQSELDAKRIDLAQAIDEENIAQAEYGQALADVGAKQAAYDSAVQDRQAKEASLNTASIDLTNKTDLKDQANLSLEAAIRALNDAQAAKDLKQSEYAAAYNQYLASKAAYDAANLALDNAISLESQAQQALKDAQDILAGKQAALNQKIATRQGIEDVITNLNSEIALKESQLTQAQNDLAQAQNEERLAQAEYDQALADVSAKQAAYDSAIQDRQVKEAELNTASANLTNAHNAKLAAENALSDGNPYIVSSYTNSTDSITLSQYKNFIDDQFNSYNSNLWYKPADSLVTIGGGSAILKGTGSSYNAAFYGKGSYNRTDRPTLSTTFKVSSTYGRFIAALDGYAQGGAYRRVGIYVYYGRIYLQTVTGATTSNKATLISYAKANTNYNLEFELTPQDIKIYLWENAAQKPANPSYTYTVTDWDSVRPYFSAYSGTATIDYVTMKSPNFNSTYNSNSQLMKETYPNGNVSLYSYFSDKITISDYKKYLDSPYSLSTQGLWYKPADSLVTINDGMATLKGTGYNYNATFYSNQSFARQDDVMVRSDFSASSTQGKFLAALDGRTSSGYYRRVGVIMQGGAIYAQTVSYFTSTPAILLSSAKANTNYTVEFQATAQDIKIYLWESSGQRPTNPSYTYTLRDWTSVRPYYSLYSGTATVSGVYINYTPQARTISSTSQEYSKIIGRNQLVQNLRDSIVNETNAQAAFNLAETALDNAISLESQVQQALKDAQDILAGKQAALNQKIATRQGIEDVITNLNSEIALKESQLTQAQADLAQAIDEENIAQAEYGQALADVGAKQAAYDSAVQDRQAKEASLNTASIDLTNKTDLKDQANLSLEAAIRALNDAQAAKDLKQSEYAAAYNQYLASKAAYDAANLALDNAISLESQVQQALQDAQAIADAKKIVLDDRIANRQRLESEINDLTLKLDSLASQLAAKEAELAQAQSEELTALNDYNAAQEEVARRQLAYDQALASLNDARLAEELARSNADSLLAILNEIRGIIESFANTDPVAKIAFDTLDIIKATYDSRGALLEALSTDGTVQKYNDGLLQTLRDGAGKVSDYLYPESSSVTLSGIIIKRDGLVRRYRMNGNLAEISSDDITLKIDQDAISRIEKKDGTIIENATFDANNNIVSAKVTKPDGIIAYYEAGILVKLEQPDGQVFEYDTNGTVTRSVNKNGIVYLYSSLVEGSEDFIIAEAQDQASIQDPEEVVYQRYNSEKRLVQAKRKNGEVLDYTYIKDAQGKVVETRAFDGKTITTYDADNNITRTEIPQTDTEPAVVSEYEYGRIRRVYKGDELIYRYTYEFDSEGKEVTVIEDIKTGDIKRYKDEALVSVTDKNNLVTSYEYNADKKVSRSAVTRSGKLINRYTYTYQGDLMTVEDIDGLRRTYDKDNKMVFLEEDGKTYGYTYVADSEGKETTIQELVRVKDKDNNIANYSAGALTSVARQDGSVIKDIVFTNGEAASYTLEKGGTKYYVEDGRLTHALKQDGTQAAYYPNGWVRSITDPHGIVTNYSYEFEMLKSSNLDGTKSNAELSADGASLGLTTLPPDAASKLLLHFNGDNGQASSIDSSQFNHPITFNDGAHLDSTIGRFGSSLFFDGVDDSLTTPDSDDWSFGTGDFTIDTWFKLNGHGLQGAQAIVSQMKADGGWWAFRVSESTIYFTAVATGTGTQADINAENLSLNYNEWYHLAAVRSGSNFYIFLNGASQPLTVYTPIGTMPNVTESLYIGEQNHPSNPDAYYWFNGSLDELRISKGTARWTQDFTPPDAEYHGQYNASGSFTSNPIELNATELDTISWTELAPVGTDVTIQTRTGNTATPDVTWSDWSGVLTDPLGSKITSPAARYIQYKVNLTTSDPNVTPKLLKDANGNYVTINYVRPYVIFMNADTGGAQSQVEVVEIGGEENLKLSYMPPDAASKLLLHFNGDNGQASSIDSSQFNHPITFNDGAHLGSTIGRFGSSLFFDGVDDNLTTPDSDDWSFGTGDFTIDLWVRFNALGDVSLVNQWSTDHAHAWDYWALDYNNESHNLVFSSYSGQQAVIGFYTAWNPSANTWYHLALERKASNNNSGDWAIFVDGASRPLTKWTGQWNNAMPDLNDALYLGARYYSNINQVLNGSLDELRISKGTARWTQDFTPPDAEYHGQYNASGSFTSNPIELNATELDTISWTELAPVGTDVTIQTRTGNTATPDVTWSDWSGVLTDPLGSKITSPAAQYIQYRVNLATNDPDATPLVTISGSSGITIKYIQDTPQGAEVVYVTIERGGIKYRYTKNELLAELATLKFDLAELAQISQTIDTNTLADDSIVRTEDFKSDQDDITLSRTKDNRITYFVNGKMDAVYQRYDDGHLELLIDYSYDADGNLILVRLPYARDSIDSQIAIARQRIAEEKANYLRTLAQQKSLAYIEIANQVNNVRDQINAERSRLQPMLYQEVTRVSQGCWGSRTYTETVEVPEVRAVLNQLDEQERTLNNEESQAYSDLDTEVAQAEASLAQDETSSLAEVANQEAIFHAKIVEEESTPVILEYYRAILGRDPDDAETQAILAAIDYNSQIDVAALKASLMASSERVNQEAFVGRLNDAISTYLNNYLSASPSEKPSLLSSLGLAPEDAVSLDQKEIDGILAFLSKQNIHFGRSAFVALEVLLKDNNITYNFEDLALKTILVDIFTGAINSLSAGTLLELSMYSLSNVASLYGLTLYNTKLSFDDLKGLSQTINPAQDGTVPLNIIAHLKNNHFVVVTNIDTVNNKITYVELNRGANGYTWTVSKEDFLNSWTGYTIVPSLRGGAEGADEAISIIQNKQISAEEAQRIKGSCLPFLFALVWGIVQVVATVAVGVISAIGAIAGAIASVIGPIIGAIAGAIGQIVAFMGGIIGHLFTAIQFVGVSLLKGIGAILGGALFGGAAGGAAGVTSLSAFLTSLAVPIGNTVVLTALTYGLSMGLEAIGVSPRISPYITSFITGGIRGMMVGGPMGFLVGGIAGLAMQGINDLGRHFGVDPMLTNILSTTAGALIGAAGNSFSIETGFNFATFSNQIGSVVLPNVAGELAYYGVTKLGESLGIDPRISSLAGIGIRSSINIGLSGGSPSEIWTSVKNGLIQGITNVTLDFLSEQLNISPILTELGFNTITSAISGLMSAWSTNSPPIQSMFGAIMDGWKNATLNLARLGLQNPNDAWQQAAYLANIQNFADIIRNGGSGFDGLVNALNTYASSMLRSGTIQGMMNIGTTVAGYVNDQLSKLSTREEEGKAYKYMRLPGTENYDPDLPAWAQDFMKFEEGDDGKLYLVGIKEGNRERSGAFGIDSYAYFGQTSGKMIDILEAEGKSFEAVRSISNGGQRSVDIRDLSTGEIVMFLYQNDDGTWDIIDTNSGYNFKADINSGELLKAYQSYTLQLSPETKASLAALGINADEYATLSYGLEMDPASRVLHTVPLSMNFTDETKAILAEHPELLDYYLRDYISYQEMILNTPELGSELQRAALENLLTLRSQLNSYAQIGFRVDDWETFKQITAAEVGSEIPDFDTRFKLNYDGISRTTGVVPKLLLGFKDSVEIENIDGTTKSTIKIGQIVNDQNTKFWVDKWGIRAYPTSEIQILRDLSDNTWSMEGSIRAEAGLYFSRTNAQVSYFGKVTGKAEDIAARGAGGVKLGGGNIDWGTHTITTGTYGKVDIYSYANKEISIDQNETLYNAFKIDYEAPLKSRVSFEFKANKREIEEKDPSSRTQMDNIMKMLGDLNSGTIGALPPAVEDEIIEGLYAKIESDINLSPELANTITDNDKLIIRQAIADNIKSLSQINAIRYSPIENVQSLDANKLTLMKIDSDIMAFERAQN